MTIKILSNSTINKIAAGEVIERPASVVKELVENAIDAGANSIDITLDCAGKNLIIISDNGSGMSADDLSLAILRHATSKLDEDDLLNINSFGFRGEALPSIGAISKFKITSKKKGADKAHIIAINGGKVEPLQVTNSREGTIVEVRDLFFSTPARLKFLRSDRTELAAIVNLVKKIALAHPNIGFTFISDNKELLRLRRQESEDEEALRVRLIDIIGEEFAENAAKIDFVQDDIAIYGYASIPTFNRASGEDQFLFINNRPVKDKLLNIALKVAYKDYLASGRHPVAAVFLRINSQLVDVNVHPAKTEVRFHNPNAVQSMFISAIKEALSKSSHKVSTTTSKDALRFMTPNHDPQSSMNEQKALSSDKHFLMPFNKPSNSGVNANYNYTSNDTKSPQMRADYAMAHQASNGNAGFFSNMNVKQNEIFSSHPATRMIEENIYPNMANNVDPGEESSSINSAHNPSEVVNHYPLGAVKAQLHATYILSQTQDSIIITDQHAAHERLGYEKIKHQIETNGLIVQRLLIPEIVELPDAQRANLLEENKESLEKLGMMIEKFGDKSIIVSTLPSLIGDVNPVQLVKDLADHFLEMGENIALTNLIEHVTETYACHYAIRAGRVLSAYEMNQLLREMEKTPFSGQCNHGRPTYVELKLKDIEKLFGRR